MNPPKQIPLTILLLLLLEGVTCPIGGQHTADLHVDKNNFDPEINMDAAQLITSKGYPCEEHYVTTEDGYILRVQRIPNGKNKTTEARNKPKPAVLLQHGLLAASTNWINNLEYQSLGFILADSGFDVWLGNMRGNTYGRNHTTLSPSSRAFWRFSWDEMAKYDLPAMVNFILNQTGNRALYYVGHSQGTLIGFAQFSQDLVFAQKIKHFFALGPVVTVKDIKGPLRWIAPFTNIFSTILRLFGYNEFEPSSRTTRFVAKYFCKEEYQAQLCESIEFLIFGPDSSQMNATRIPVYLAHTPAGTSTENVAHFGQMVNSGKCRKFDYGFFGNMKHYKQRKPPAYDISLMESNVSLFWGEKDWLADPADIKRNLIPNVKHLQENFYYDDYNHVDFIVGLNAYIQVYPKIVAKIRKIEGISEKIA